MERNYGSLAKDSTCLEMTRMTNDWYINRNLDSQHDKSVPKHKQALAKIIAPILLCASKDKEPSPDQKAKDRRPRLWYYSTSKNDGFLEEGHQLYGDKWRFST